MTKVKNSELTSLKSAEAFTNLDPLGSALKILSDKMGTFVDYSDRRLKGDGYDAIRKHVDYFAASFSKLGQFDINVFDNVNENTDKFIAYMDGDEQLDDSEIPSIEEKLETIKNKINDYNAKIDNYYYQVNVNKRSAPSDWINYLKSELQRYENDYRELEKKYNKLKELEPTNKATGSCVDLIEGDINKFKSIYGID